jgi:hypothetical protein
MAAGEWCWSSDWIDHYPYDNGDPDGDDDLGDDYFQPWLDVIAHRDEAERLLTGVLDVAPNDRRAALLAALLWYDRWVTFRMLSEELPDDADIQATGRVLLERAPLVMRAEEGTEGVTAILRAEAEAAGAGMPHQFGPAPSRWSWYLIRRSHMWHNNGELAHALLVTADATELRWAYDAWAGMELYREASFVFEVYQAGERALTVDLAAEPLPTPLPELAADPLPFGQPTIAHVDNVALVVHHGYSVDIS